MRHILILLLFFVTSFFPAAETVVVKQGKIKAVCKLPDPQTAPYGDCDYAVKFVYQSGGKQKESIVLMPGFRARKMCPEAAYIENHEGFYEMSLCDFWDAPEADQSRQNVNTFDAEIEEVFFLRKIRRIESIANDTGQGGQDIVKSIIKIKKHPLHKQEAVQARKAAIAGDLKYLDGLFMKHGGSLSTWEEELAPVWKSFINPSQNGLVQVGDAVVTKLLYDVKSRTLPRAESYGKTAAKALINLNKLLKQQNIDLIVVPYPDGYDMAFEYFCRVKSSDGFAKPKDLAFIRYLLQNDVEVINLYPALLKEQKKHRYFYNYPDYHPNCFSYEVAAGLIAERLQRYSYDHSSCRVKAVTAKVGKKVTVDGKTEVIPMFKVRLPQRSAVSPHFLLVGDSFMNGAFPYIVEKLSVLPEKYYRNGGAFDIFRFLTTHSKGIELLTSRPVCIFIFDVEHLRLSWFNIPSAFPVAEKKLNALPLTIKLENFIRRDNQFIMQFDQQTTRKNGFLEIPDAGKIRALSFYIESVVLGDIRIKTTVTTSDGKMKELGMVTSRSGPDKIEIAIPENSGKIKIHFQVRDERKIEQKDFSVQVFSIQ